MSYTINMYGHITGVGWRNEELMFEIRAGNEKELYPLQLGQEFAFYIPAKRKCIGYRPADSASLIPCPESASDIGASQCANCFERAEILPCLRCDGERCRNPARRSFCVQPKNHALYLASFAPGEIKVGVARWQRRQERLFEQGAQAAIICARDDGQMIRRYEKQISNFGFPDRLQAYEKLNHLTIFAEKEELEKELLQVWQGLKKRMRAPWLDNPEKISLPTQPLLSYPPRLLQPAAEMTIRAKVEAISGQIIILRTDGNENIALEAGSLVGYEVEEITEDQGTSGQMSLALQ